MRHPILLVMVLALTGCPFDKYLSPPEQVAAVPAPKPTQDDKTAEQIATMRSQIKVALQIEVELENRIAALEKAEQAGTNEPAKDRTTIMWSTVGGIPGRIYTMPFVPDPRASFNSQQECLKEANAFVEAQPIHDAGLMRYTNPDGSNAELRCLPLGVDPRHR